MNETKNAYFILASSNNINQSGHAYVDEIFLNAWQNVLGYLEYNLKLIIKRRLNL